MPCYETMSTATPKSIRSRKTPSTKPTETSPRVSAVGAGQPRATDRGLRLVSIVADHPNGVSLADAARAADLTSSTALRQLRSLESAGFAVHLPDSRWAPGEELFRIARSLGQDSLARLAQSVLVSLAEQIGESAYLAEPVDTTTATYTAMEQSHHAIRHVSWLGRPLSRRNTAVGAALKGNVDPDGTALREDAVELGVTAISAPVRDERGVVVAAVSVVGPSYRLRAFGLAKARGLVADAAASLASALTTRVDLVPLCAAPGRTRGER